MDASERWRGLHEGREAFNRGAFFEAHEIWESVWMRLEGRDRTSVQALIQIAVALLKVEDGRPDVATRILERALAKLASAPESIDGLDLERFARDARDASTEIANGRRPLLRLYLVAT